MTAVQSRSDYPSGCAVLWCENPHHQKRPNLYHYTVLQRSQHNTTSLTASLGWQEGSQRGPYVAIEAISEIGRHLCILPIGIAEALARLITFDAELYGPGGRFLAESIDVGAAILE